MPANVASQTLLNAPVSFAFVQTNLAAFAWVFPTNAAQTVLRWPGSNTRQIVILNRGNNPLLFGITTYSDIASLPGQATVLAGVPYALPALTFPQALGPGPVPTEGSNCTRIPVGASFTLDLLPFQERGNMTPVPLSSSSLILASQTAYPTYLIFFGAVGGDTTADITYVNTFGAF
jgi:hypothetical protein